MMVKIFFDLDRLSIAHLVDFDEIKIIEGNLPGSLLGGIRSTQRSKIAPKRSKIGLKINSRKHMFLWLIL